MTPRAAPPLLVVQHEDRVPLGRIAFPGLPVDVVRPDRGEPLPTSPAGYAGLVVLGGTMAAWQDDVAPWLPATRALLARAVDDDVPVLGICLGAQLLAMATGGRVEPGGRGPELGVIELHATPDAAQDPLLGGLGERWLGPSGHHDAVTELPPGAVLLASSADYPHQAFRLGNRAWGVQYHPEVPADVFADWMAGDRDVLSARGTTVEALLADFTAVDGELDRLATAHGAAFAAAAGSPAVAAAPA